MTEQHKDMFGASGFGDTSGFGGLAVREQQLVSSPKPYATWMRIKNLLLVCTRRPIPTSGRSAPTEKPWNAGPNAPP